MLSFSDGFRITVKMFPSFKALTFYVEFRKNMIMIIYDLWLCELCIFCKKIFPFRYWSDCCHVGWLQDWWGWPTPASRHCFFSGLRLRLIPSRNRWLDTPWVELPKKVLDWKQANSHKLDICSGYVSDETRNMIVEMLNDDWTISVKDRGGKLHHYCPPGCCDHESMPDQDEISSQRDSGKFLWCSFALPLEAFWPSSPVHPSEPGYSRVADNGLGSNHEQVVWRWGYRLGCLHRCGFCWHGPSNEAEDQDGQSLAAAFRRRYHCNWGNAKPWDEPYVKQVTASKVDRLYVQINDFDIYVMLCISFQ